MALGCYDVFVERGIGCPEEISVVGFNDMPFLGWFDPPLTTVHLPHYEIGARRGELCSTSFAIRTGAAQVHARPTLVVRGSTAAPR